MKNAIPGMPTRRTALLLNVIVVVLYVAIVLSVRNVLVMVGCFLLLALIIRCVIVWQMARFVERAQFDMEPSQLTRGAMVLWTALLGLLFAAVLLVVLWAVGQLWPSGFKFLLFFTAVTIAYKSTFPL
jgi:hypothetical protein